ncbi:MAG: HEPN domain-containing protein [bacterium]|nr:HEPN domain-containing protein [bacterium]
MQNLRITKYVSDWLRLAEDDIATVEILIKENISPNSICFHSQQAVEKLLKGFLAYQEKNVRKVHDIKMLVSLCEEIDKEFSDLYDEADYFSKFYIETRYPGDFPEFSWTEAKEAFEAAKKIKEFVLAKIK